MVWVNSQFGAGNPYGPRVFCHVLEDRLGTTRWLVSAADVPAARTVSARGRAAATAPYSACRWTETGPGCRG